MTRPEAWRGERRLRVGLKIADSSADVVSMWLVDGPAVQRPSLSGPYVARVEVDGAVALVQAFEQPDLIRGIAPPEEVGHSFKSGDPATIHVDIPFKKGASLSRASIRIADLTEVPRRPTDPAAIARILDKPDSTVRVLANVSTKQLATHPDWPASIAGSEHPQHRSGPISIVLAWLRRTLKRIRLRSRTPS